MKRMLLLPVLSVVVLMFSFSGVDGAPYYEGKRITIIVGTAPGGGYDNVARLVSRHLPKYIPGKPVMLVNNVLGAGTVVAANQLYTVSKPDGFTIGTLNRALVFAQLTKMEGIRFDVRKFSWIGSMAVDPTVFFIRADLPYKTVDDLRKGDQLALSSEGLGSGGHQFNMLLNEFVKIPLKIVVYESSAHSRLAIERKEVDGMAGSYSSAKAFVDRGILRPMIRGRASIPDIEKLPVNEDLTSDPKGKTIMGMLGSVDLISRPFMAPPGVPENVMNILKDGFAKMAQDPEVLAEAKKLGTNTKYVSAEEAMKVINYIMNQPEPIIQEFSKYIKF